MEDGKIIRDGKPEEVLREVELTDRIGIMSMQIPKYFSKTTVLKGKDLPLTQEEGIRKFKELELKIDENKYEEILQKEEEREQAYGDVIIEVKDLEHTYPNGKKALKGIDLEIKEGEF